MTRLGFQAGLVAGAAAALVMLAARIAFAVPTIAELLLDQVTFLVPPLLFALVLDRLLFAAKPLMMGGIVVGQLLLCGVVGAIYGRSLASLRSLSRAGRWALALALSGAVWLVSVLGVLPLVGADLLGSELPVGAATVSVALLLAALVFGLTLASITDWESEQSDENGGDRTIGRRRVIRALGWGSVALAAGAFVVRGGSLLAANAAATLSSRRPAGKLPPEVTPNEDFYVVSKNFTDPVVDAATWRLEISGLVEKPITLTYGDLTALPAVEQYTTLECISNEVGGNLISNARWKGVPLRDLLTAAGPKPGVRKVKLTAADGYDDSVAFDRAMGPANLLAWEMNGETLPPAHGFPARLLVPGIYGMKNVKWLTRIELVDYDFRGYWMQRGWDDLAYVKAMSRIDLPPQGERLMIGPQQVGGIAFSGDKGIGRVEVSFDDGATWRRATVKQALSQYTWVLWILDWEAPDGLTKVLVRTADASGRLQDQEQKGSLPDGASGYHSILVTADSDQR